MDSEGTMKACGTIDPLLSAFADGELFGSERDTIERHMAECAVCRGTVETYRTVGLALREHMAAEAAVVPAALTWPPRRRALRVPVLTPRRPLNYHVARRLHPWPVLAGAAALAMLVIGLATFRASGPPANVVEIERVDAAGPVLVLPGKEGRMTIIWVFEADERSAAEATAI